MPLILLIRHAENDHMKKDRLAGRLPGVHLNKDGRAHAQVTAEKLKDAPLKAIYSSPLERALETAEIIAQPHNLPVTVRPGLMETDCGDWQDKTVKSLRRLKIWRVVQSAPSRFRFPGGETFTETQLRICQEVEALCAQHDPKDVIACVSHADPIRLAVAFFVGLPLDLFQRLALSPASITALMIGETGSQLLTLNYDPAFTIAKPKT